MKQKIFELVFSKPVAPPPLTPPLIHFLAWLVLVFVYIEKENTICKESDSEGAVENI